ncbi:DMT family transporter [Halalkalibacter urbisdiaboli]|uniref:DMT family transporter n=1 Tax=Halalkalibacter urbisdiaboli TaxID=1960589 RepID=UPI001FDA9710|nr:DMT family transporter [Halalkalibacter urbisdiaboli]
MNKQAHIGVYIIAFSAMATWGVNVVMLKVLVEALPPSTMTSFRILFAGIALLGIAYYTKSFRTLTKLEWRNTLLGALFGVVIHHYFLAHGLTLTNASNTALILALVPITTSIFAIIFLGDRLTKWRLLGIVLAFFGVLLVQGGSGTLVIHKGELFIFIAMLAQALGIIYIKKATHTLDSKQVTGMMLVFGSFSLLLLSLFLEPQGLSEMVGAPPFIYVVFFISSIIATAGGQYAFNFAIQKIGAGQAAVFNNLVPLFGLLSAAVFLGETVHWYQFLSFLFIISGVLLGTGYIERTWLKTAAPLQEKSM